MYRLLSKKAVKTQGGVRLHSDQSTLQTSTLGTGCLVLIIPFVGLTADIAQTSDIDSADRGRSSLSPLSTIAEDSDYSDSPPPSPYPFKGPPAAYQRDEEFFGPHGFARCINKVQSPASESFVAKIS